MKLKFVLVPLIVLGVVVASYADCTKDEIMKLIDKGYSKTEINGICGKSEVKKEESKWISPTQKVCKANGGKMDEYTCKATWSNAKDICLASGGRLPTIDELREVLIGCGGIEADASLDDIGYKNFNNKSYQSCFKEKGFHAKSSYWSSSIFVGPAYDVWIVGFVDGAVDGINVGVIQDYEYLGTPNLYVRCVRDGQ